MIQEYLTAMHASRLPRPDKELVPLFPDVCALVVASSPTPEESMEEVLKQLLDLHAQEVAVRFAFAFLSRISTERPSFEMSPRFGWIMATFLSIVGGIDIKNDTYGESLHNLVTDPTVLKSLNALLPECELVTEGGYVRLVPMPGGNLPPFLFDAIAERKLRSIRLVGSSSRRSGLLLGSPR